MNKKIIVVVSILLVVIAGIGIWMMQGNKSDRNESTEGNTSSGNHKNENVAIVYFSATGNTEQVAQYIQEATNGTLIEIVPQEEYTDNDLNYGNEDSRTSQEQNSNDARPAIANDIDVSSYDVIYLGYPIWWGDVPKIILTFLDEVDLSGKTVIPFCTSGGSGIESSMETLKNYNSSIHWIDGKRLSISKSDIVDWVNQLDY